MHNLRNCDYRTDADYTPRWETRTVRISQITGIDIAIDYWGVKWMAHPIISFQFAYAPPVCFSIETRRKVGQTYSAVGGLYRQYELIYVVSDERDVIRLRTNYRHEDIYLYRLKATPDKVRAAFLDYVQTVNILHDQPRWYNAVTDNCTTAIRNQRTVNERTPWDWRMLINGYADRMLYERGSIDTSLPFAELKRRSLINDRAILADRAADFSQLIRLGLPGMSAEAKPNLAMLSETPPAMTYRSDIKGGRHAVMEARPLRGAACTAGHRASQPAAIFMAMIGREIPSIQFAGLISPVSSLQGIAIIAQVFPSCHFRDICRGVFYQGAALLGLGRRILAPAAGGAGGSRL